MGLSRRSTRTWCGLPALPATTSWSPCTRGASSASGTTRRGRQPTARPADATLPADGGALGQQLRLFVAVLLPEAWTDYLAARGCELERLAPGYTRWVTPELMHLTVVFLGAQPADRLADVEAALATAARAARPFSLALGHIGQFGGTLPRVL